MKISLLDNHVMMCAVRFTARVCRCDSQRSSDVTQVGSDCVVRNTDHYAVLGSHTIVCSSHALWNNHFPKIITKQKYPEGLIAYSDVAVLPSLRSQSPFGTIQLMPPGQTFLINSQSKGLNGGLVATSCSRLEMQMQMGFSAGRSCGVQINFFSNISAHQI